MITVKTCFVLLIVLTTIDFYQCGRNSGSRGGGGGYRSRPTGHTTRRPYTTPRSTHQPYTSTYRPYSSTYRPPVNYASSTYRPSTTRRSQYSTRTTPRSQTNEVGWNLPPKPGTSYTTNYNGPQNVKIVNKYNYHYPGYYSVPVQNQAHPGYFYSPSSYHYGAGDTGSTALGFFLGYGLAKLTTPTYSHYSFYDGYRPRYDHYEVHHYYHNKDSVPQNQEIRANTIVGCVGDSSTICPANTTSLCTSNGALMCVVSAISTVPCTDNRQINCVTSTIACVNNTTPECKNSQSSTTINIPCVSKAEVYGDLKTVNNTIIPANATLNGTANSNTTVVNNTTVSNSSVISDGFSTQYPITTTPSPIPSSERTKREVPQSFCVTIIALPAKRKETEGEKVFKDAKFILDKFVDSAL